MSSAPQRRAATYADLANLPEHVTGELIDGVVMMSPRPSIAHQIVAAGLHGRLFQVFRGPRGGGPDRPGGWIVLPEPELHLGHPDPRSIVLVPDLAGWRLPRHPGHAPATEVVPDWVCEILSPGTHRRDRLIKLDQYGLAGVPHAWIVDPDEGTLEGFTRGEDGIWRRPTAINLTDALSVAPFDAVTLDPFDHDELPWLPPRDDADDRGRF